METRTTTNPDLLFDLENFELDDPESHLPFSIRLGRDVGWSPAFASAVCREYLRFIYLAMIADGAVTPSEEVDQAWHLHLVYTRSYWDDLCGKVLKRPLQHGPTKGGSEEDHRYFDQYRRTLELYEREFGEKPREDIWPAMSERFRCLRYQMVAPTHSWVIRKDVAANAAGSALMLTFVFGVFLNWLTMGRLFSWGPALVLLIGFWTFLVWFFYSSNADWSVRSEAPKRDKNSASGGLESGGCGSSGCGSGCGGGCGS